MVRQPGYLLSCVIPERWTGLSTPLAPRSASAAPHPVARVQPYDARELNRRLVIALACLAALGGCATSLATNDNAPASERSTSPSPTSPPSQPVSNFGSSAPHWFGSGGP